MLIDGSPSGAQALNFLILVWLRKRSFYKPISTPSMNGRSGSLQSSRTRNAKRRSPKEHEEFQRKMAEFDQTTRRALSKATGEAQPSAALIDEARKRPAPECQATGNTEN